ncbi:MAG: phosphate acyltransferase PlsX [Eubacteriales bacterium]|nr:phosphate acyltransferase PlsX [Eubacteriales bacterium]
MFTIAVDVMGGDYAPEEPVLGIAEALRKHADLKIIAFGDKESIESILSGVRYPAERLEIRHTDEVIGTAESPVVAVRKKRSSSLVSAIRAVADGTADSCLSAGNSGAVLVAAQAYIKRIPGVRRTPLGPLIPTLKGPAILVDCGANVDARAEHLHAFAKLGSAYLEHICGIKAPRVALVNIGAEEEKGNKLVKETFPLLKADKHLNFIGSVEARDLLAGEAQVIVCDAFVGNVALKLVEGMLSMMKNLFRQAVYSSTRAKLGGMLLKKDLKKVLDTFDISEYGGAPLLGLEGLVVKCHGNARRQEVATACTQSLTFLEQDMNTVMKQRMEESNE